MNPTESMAAAYVGAIGTAVPVNKISQEEHLNYLLSENSHDRESTLLLKKLYKVTGIENRYSVIPDFVKENKSLFQNSKDVTISARMDLYKKYALPLTIEAVNNCFSQLKNFNPKQVTHLITFSCTGMYAPGLDIELVEVFKMNLNVERTCINFMGCYAAINAMKSAYHIVRSEPDALVLIAGVELCSIHSNHSRQHDQIIANALFGDGAAAALVSSRKLNEGIHLKINSFYSEFNSNGKDEMIWSIADKGFNLKLSAYVPKMIQAGIKSFIDKLFDQTDLSADSISYYAIHPGGVKILQACESALNISSAQLTNSYQILKQFGNMSSVTLLFVIQKYLEQMKEKDKEKIMFCCAFGPGLTMESMLLEIA